MPIDQKSFSGFLNSDDSQEVMPMPHHKMAMNGRFRGIGNNTRFENDFGTTLIPNTDLPTGNNECIGSFYDSLNQRIIWFNWNSNSRHGIYMYDKIQNTITPLLICFTDSQTDILGFDLDYPIPSVDIIYTTEEDGDLLTWTARNKRPKILNIKDAIDNLYGSDWLEEYLDVQKEIPRIPIKCAYENDSTVAVNNMRKVLFIPKYRWLGEDNLKSCWSAWGNMPIPYNYLDPQVTTDLTKNCRIGMVVQTGGADVRKIEIAVAQQSATGENAGNQWGDFFSVVELDKDELNIPDNDVYIYRFYNNEAYLPIDVKESNLTFDYIPDIANTQTLLNGNVICYGGCQEGKDTITPDVSVSASNQLPTAVNPYSVLSVTQAGQSGFEEGDITFIVLGNIRMNDIYSAQILVGSTTYTITYTASYGDTPATVLAGLSTSATGQGFTEVSIDANTLIISRTGQILQKSNLQTVSQTISGDYVLNASANTITRTGGGVQYLSLFPKGTLFYISPVVNSGNTKLFMVTSSANVATNLVLTVDDVTNNETVTGGTLTLVPSVGVSIPAYNPSSKENLGVVYFDEKGKTNGVITDLNFNASANAYSISLNLNTLLFSIPYFNLTINHRPPDWAYYYHIVRSNNLTKLKYLYWMTDRTYKDDKYAYISIQTIQSYKLQNPNSIISYDFTPGDRIKFYVLFNADSTPGAVYFNEHDYEIYEQVINPDINGVIRQGQFLKLVLPTTSATFDFSNGVTKTFCYYFAELYTPAKSATPSLSTYFEFSQRYAIINPTDSTRSHQGQLQNQTSDLVTPATFKLDTGDAYYRTRAINVGDELSYDLEPRLIEPNFIIGQTLTRQLLPNPDYIVASSVAYQQLIGTGGFYNNAGWTINDVTSSYTFHVTGIINFSANVTTVGLIRFIARVADSANNVTDFILGSQTGATAGTNIQFNPSVDVIMPANSKVFVYMTCADANFRANLISGNLSWVEPLKTFYVGCIDQNFSDFYDSKVNSNGRPFVVNKNEKQIFLGTMVRWGLAYLQNTNVNQINRFYGQNFDESDRSYGSIQRLAIRQREMIVFHERAVGRYGVYQKFLQSNPGENIVTTTDEIITKNNINYVGHFGVGNQYCNVIKGREVFYFKDPVRGYDVRLSAKGLDPISEQNKGQFYIQPKFIPYSGDYLRTNGSRAKILGAYNFYEEEAITVLQSGSTDGVNISPYTFSWNEKRNSYCSFFDFVDPDWIESLEDIIVTWKRGQMYLHNNQQLRCNYYGIQFYPSITLVFNGDIGLRKTFNAFSYQANQNWIAPVNGDVITGQPNPQTNLQQISSLREWNLEIQEGRYDLYLNRDANSMSDAKVALVEGDYLKGSWIQIKLTYFGSEFAFLYLPYINYSLSPRNY